MAVRIGDPEQIQALANRMSQVHDEFAARVQALNGHFEGMAAENSWNDDIYRDHLQKFADIRNALAQALAQLDVLAVGVSAMANRYNDIR